MRATRRIALLSLAVLTASLASITAADARSRPSDRAQVRQFLAPMDAFGRAMAARRSELDQLGAAWAAGVTPCLQAAYAELERESDAGTLTPKEAMTDALILYSVALEDATADRANPLDSELATVQRAYRRMAPADRVLRAGARGKAREIAAVRALPDIDTCGFADAWAKAGFSLVDIPDLAPGLSVVDDFGGDGATLAVERAAKRLHRMHASNDRAGAFQAFPVLPLAEPALSDALFPPAQLRS